MPDTFPFPETVRRVAENVLRGCDFTSAVKEFGDSILRDLQSKGARAGGDALPIDPAAFSEEPAPLPNPVQRAYLAGLAEHLASLSAQPAPDWTSAPGAFLAEPVFLGGPRSRDRLLAEAPAAFRRRLLFCGAPLQKLRAILGEGS